MTPAREWGLLTAAPCRWPWAAAWRFHSTTSAPLALKVSSKRAGKGSKGSLEQSQDGPGGPGIDGHFRGFLLGEQVPGRQGQGGHPGGRIADFGGVVNNHAVRGQLVPVEEDGFLVQGH